MASRVSNLLRIIGRSVPEPGAHMYHAADGVAGGGFYNSDRRHQAKKALYKQRLRASGMTDDILGAKEVGGTLDDPHEQEV